MRNDSKGQPYTVHPHPLLRRLLLELRPDPVKEKNAKTQTKESANFFARVEGFWL